VRPPPLGFFEMPFLDEFIKNFTENAQGKEMYLAIGLHHPHREHIVLVQRKHPGSYLIVGCHELAQEDSSDHHQSHKAGHELSGCFLIQDHEKGNEKEKLDVALQGPSPLHAP
jgi:hypothetical protein